MYYRLITHVIAGRVIVQPGRRQGDSCPHRKGPHDTALIVFTIIVKPLPGVFRKPSGRINGQGRLRVDQRLGVEINSTTRAGFAGIYYFP